MRLLFLLSTVLLFLGCKKETECNYDPCVTVAPSAEIQAVRDFLTANSITATQHCSGLFYKIESLGTGDYPDGCSNVSVNYVGKLTNGDIFDQIPKPGTPGPISFNLQGVIKGWTNGVPELREGGRITLYIPPSLGYGTRAVGSIPANSILVFDITLVNVQ